MRISRASLDTCSEATGTVVVIDVLRAFTTAAFAFAAGAREILLVSTVAEALALRARLPGALAMGEVDGLPVAGFDLGNSPAALIDRDLTGRRLIQRTSAGTQGVVRSVRADVLLASSLCCASATARYIRARAPDTVTFVLTGLWPGGWGDEDAAGADYIAALLRGERPDIPTIVRRVQASRAAQAFADPARPEFPAADLACSVAVDRFDLAMPVTRQGDRLVMRAVRCGPESNP
ncbi:MAG: 2-phosphosulfolactate phosphatase [Chloroflexi bacterium]|nr:2-phosphosulfolactate phosphatase [Chloroflexota bacterium]MBU1749289.1 2-phosphosulfolactate phosphatase [Chloroflexota bacterium]